MDSIPSGRRASAAALLSDTRRGSLPHLYYGAWTGPGGVARESWTPTQAAQRNVNPAAVIDKSFKFGSPPLPSSGTVPSTGTDEPTAVGSLQRLASLPTGRRKNMSAFESTEQQEADRQRKAFLAATYGEDSRRARARLSLGGPSASPGSPSSTRRQSLLLWERINKPPEAGASQAAVSAAAIAAVAATTVPANMLHDTLERELGRRPSLPVNIPMRTPTIQAAHSFEDQSVWDDPDSIDPDAVSHNLFSL